MFSVRIAATEELAGLRTEWNRLAAAMRLATPFATWEWAKCWRETFGAARGAVVLLIHEGDALRGILPLATSASHGQFGARGSLEIMGVKPVGADHVDLIAAHEHADACVDAAFAFLRTSALRWHALTASMLTEDSALLRRLAAAAPSAPSHSVRQASAAPYLPIAGSFDDYLATLSGNERYKLRSRTKKLLAKPGVRYHRFEFAERQRALDALFDLHKRRAHEKQIDSSFAHESVKTFHTSLLDQMPWEQVALRGLLAGDEVIAMFYGFVFARRMFYFQLGYDPAWSASSPGLVLLTRTIHDAFDAGCIEYNFLQGNEPFKQTWTRHTRPLFECRMFNRTFRGNVSHELFRLRETIRRTLRPASQRSTPAMPGQTEPDADGIPRETFHG